MGKGKDGGAECCVACGAAACCCLVIIIVIGLAGLGIAKIVMGAVYLHDCSIEDLIPVWLIVSGCAPILFGGFGKQNNEDSGDGNNLCGTICGVIGFLFNLAWLICGSVWVYPNYGKVTADDFTPCTGNVTTGCTQGDCNKSLITFAFAMATLDWIFMGLWIALIGCLIVRACKN
ncbi:uncharacterized protein LOC123554421 [Mercenaria mercenaria]|uniref:uncharacterized protein LOC123554421 n=1 Tax=Mercenaria mercenaria TaxID=6596 RepID=UPI001E1D85B1|nr:uncharacterized protein LOC123554421 [Mercenaria mercenaria]XP_045200490.1 uncharacterized protein LOC123554421 [Mercenaria mercenaria]XP_045200491.1 uncharacterized protein LOC123554421 [Mercenaria mercenaria]XP_045200492.1 uncharacterized protein LOC123554421 [Mercenaria mercenaria]XP_045200493.1 uncharacterized protein LOC123554421 [Mercenaria mercenaria]